MARRDEIEDRLKELALGFEKYLLVFDGEVPFDRTGQYGSEFQYGQRRFFERAFRALALLAQVVCPQQYVADGWRTSRTKILDNALIGYCRHYRLQRI